MNSLPTRRRLSAAVLVLATAAIFATGCGDSTDHDLHSPLGFLGPSVSSSAESSGEVLVEGLVDYPMTLTVLDMDYMDWVTVTADHPEAGPTDYDGVPLVGHLLLRGGPARRRHPDTDRFRRHLGRDSPGRHQQRRSPAGRRRDGAISAVLPGLDGDAWVEDIVSMRFE